VAEQESASGEVAVELESVCLDSALESGDELAAEDTAEHLDGEEEGAAGGDPAGAVGSETDGGERVVDMGMMLGAGPRKLPDA
jgi:hypothetical protein